MANMGSRVRSRKGLKRLFECYVIVEPHGNEEGASLLEKGAGKRSPSESTSVVKSVFPSNYSRPEILKCAAQFAFPCQANSEQVELFTFVLTSEDSKWTFGYCRHPYGSQSCILFLTFLPWQEIFYRMLNYCAEISETKLIDFLEKLYNLPVPEAGTCLYVPTNSKPFICPCPSDLSLPSIPENRNVNEFYNALTVESMLSLFSALLSERRIVITSKKLSRLSSIALACNLFLFPMSWQHIFIPVLPLQLQDYLSAPMPFIIGVPISVWDRLPPETLGQIVRVDADSDTVTTPFPEDLESMPHDVVSLLRKTLIGQKVLLLGDGLARAFLRSLAQLMGHYQDAIREDGQTFDQELFVQFAHPSHRKYIETKLLSLQIFQQFVEERLEKVRIGECESDEFELESLAWRSSRANGRNGFPFRNLGGGQNRTIRKAGKAVIMSVKRESGNIIDSVKHNSALKSAFRSVKEGGKSVKQKGNIAVSDIRSKFHVAGPSRHINSIENASAEGNKYYQNYHRQPYSGQPGSQFPADSSLRNGNSSRDSNLTITSRDDNLVHLMPFSSSASKMNDLTLSGGAERVEVRPRLSKSEENLIDLDTPGGLGFTLENPLYDLVANNCVFEETDKTDAELLVEYGLSEYFNNMNVTDQGSDFSVLDSVETTGNAAVSIPNDIHRNLNRTSNSCNWTTFEKDQCMPQIPRSGSSSRD